MDSPMEPIAVVGTACRFPGGVDSSDKFWELLRDPHDVSHPIDAYRFSLDRFYGSRQGTIMTQRSYFLDQKIDQFDAQFFGISPAEAEAIDPQQRILLEVVYETLEAAGILVEHAKGSDTAVYIGQMCHDYQAMTSRDINGIPTYHATGTATSSTANRVSYFFNWHGPSMVVDTACSSSLVALHLAVQQIRSGASTLAVAAGTNLILDPFFYISMSNLSMLSPTGKSQMWDAQANGYARGEGVAAVVLKPLHKALQDGDHIECLIRETGINQDGRTQGITTPNGVMQAQLIRDTYHRAGLKPTPENCQFFEAHGTGTQAGDPQEAQAICNAFFDGNVQSSDRKLWVGSAKTVVGHAEGCAGLAGLLKASAALQNSTIPPNLLFHTPNPKLEEYMKHLQVPTTTKAWPPVLDGEPRRASVNSFGFGGTNSHTILESYTHSAPSKAEIPGPNSLLPFVFSAKSKRSLMALIQKYLAYLESNHNVPLNKLSYTLCCRRSVLPYKAAFSASTAGELTAQMRNGLDDLGTHSDQDQPQVLGVFTGQGAQWPKMGARLIEACPSAQQRLDELDQVLQSLPDQDRPGWMIRSALTNWTDAQQINDPVCSQTLCTAVQILLVDLLLASKIRFTAVVGHSSGEIAASYAAGYLSAENCIQIAYYRGLHVSRGQGTSNKKGAMIAVGMPLNLASSICEQERFAGRLAVAAWNSVSSVTLSGDEDAVSDVQDICHKDKRFARRLRVGTAYHSHHMTGLTGPYMESMENCEIEVRNAPSSPDRPIWFSSVGKDGTRVRPDRRLKSHYWVDNMRGTVCFYPALVRAVDECGPFNLVVEIGPHPALKGPVLDVLKEAGNSSVPYVSPFMRDQNDCQAFALAIGSIWTRSGPTNISLPDLADFVNRGNPRASCIPLKGLPGYAWDHELSIWTESRMAHRIRMDKTPRHSLLGLRTVEGPEDEWRWQNILRPKELPWILDHRIQGRAVFPATGYILQAVEAIRQLANGLSVQHIEIRDLKIMHTAMIDDSWGLETFVILSNIEDHDGILTASFTTYAASVQKAQKLERCATCAVEIALKSLDELPSLQTRERGGDSPLIEVDIPLFRSTLQTVGYGYHGAFQGLSDLRRRTNYAEASIASQALSPPDNGWLFHPATLDNAIQSIFAAYSAPGDGVLRELHVPTRIGHLKLSLGAFEGAINGGSYVASQVTEVGSNRITADVNIFDRDGDGISSIRDVELLPVGSQQSSVQDCEMIFETALTVECPNGPLAVKNLNLQQESCHQKAVDCQRVAFYYVRLLHELFPPATRMGTQLPPHHKALLDFCSHIVEQAHKKAHPYIQSEWFADSQPTIDALVARHEGDIDFRVVCAAGENMPAVLRDEKTILEVLDRGDMLDIWYHKGMVVEGANLATARVIRQISQRFPDLRLLEIGAGTGGTTQETIPQLGNAFLSYAFTDISSTFLDRAREKFEAYGSRMSFSKLDIGSDPVDQGFEAGFYDMISASNVLHATPRLEITLRNVRRLLKPGGYLVLTEIIGQGPLHLCLSVGGLPGWWLGQEDGRRYAPTVSLERWDELLRATGFSGVDTFTPIVDPVASTTSVIVSQAVDEQIGVLRRPLSSSNPVLIQDLLIIGGSTLRTTKMIEDVLYTLGSRCARIVRWKSLDQVQGAKLSKPYTVLNMADLDGPAFQTLSAEKWENLKWVFECAKEILWLTAGYETEDPFAAMSIGFLRSIALEAPDLQIQTLDIDHINDDRDYGRIIGDRLLQLHLSDIDRSTCAPKALWSVEPELLLKGDRLYIPRLTPVAGPNRRLDSGRRTILENVCPSVVPVELEWPEDGGGGYNLHQVKIESIEGEHTIRLQASLLFALSVPSGKMFLGAGVDMETERPCLAWSPRLSSSVRVSQSCVWPIPDDYHGKPVEYLALTAAHIFSQKIQSLVSGGSNVLVHEPSQVLASVLQRTASDQGHRLHFSSVEPRVNPGWISLASKKDSQKLQKLRRITTFINLSPSPLSQRTTAILNSYLPEYCEWLHSSSLFSKRGFTTNPIPNCDKDCLDLRTTTEASLSKFAQESNLPGMTILELETLTGLVRPPNILTIINWNSSPTVPTIVRPADSGTLFKPDRTYWLAGLSSDMGWSVCDWMAAHGARCIIITSRNPVVPTTWKEEHRSKGTVIETVASDITSVEDLQRAYLHICKAYPPIAGVFSGAMAMREQSFQLMDFDSFGIVLQPKVQGTLNIDRLFGKEPLDFFIAISSTIATIGNVGQTAYAAANMFIKSLMRKRRSRGLAGFAVDLPPVLGVGSIHRDLVANRMSARKKERLSRAMVPIATPEMHQLFAEAMFAGRPNAPAVHDELVAGLPLFADMQEFQDVLGANPRFSRLVLNADANKSNDDSAPFDKPADALHIKDRLAAVQASGLAFESNEIRQLIQQGLIAKTCRTLQLGPDALDEAKALVELGLDSLSVVDIRNWVRAEVDLELSVFQILAGMSVNDIVQSVMQTSAPSSNASADLPSPLNSQCSSTPPDADTSLDASPMTDHELHDTKDSDQALRKDEAEEFPFSGGGFTPEESPPETILAGKGELLEVSRAGQLQPFGRKEIMSPTQERLWISGVYTSNPRKYNISMIYEILGDDFRPRRFEEAIKAVVHRHPMLRTAFFLDERTGELCQGRLATPYPFWEHIELGTKETLSGLCEQAASHTWRLDQGEVLKTIFVSDTHCGRNWVIFAYHHIIIDGMSWRQFLRDLDAAYQGQFLQPPQGDYMDYSVALRQAMKTPYESFQQSLGYWQDELQPLPDPMPLLPWACVRSRQATASDTTHVISRNIGAHLVQQVSQASSRLRGTPFHFYLTTIQIVLSRILQIGELCVGVVDANRRDDRFADTIGAFVQELPLKSEVNQTESFATTFKQTSQRVLKALAHGGVPFGVILDCLNVPRFAAHTPLFQLVFNYRMGEYFQMPLGNGKLQYLESQQVSPPYDISFDVTHTAGECVVDLTYQDYLYTEDGMNLFLDLYIYALEDFAASSASPIESRPLHSPKSMEQSMHIGRGPAIDHLTWPDTITERFEQIAEQHHTQVAVVDNHGFWTYSQLALRVHQIAAVMVARGIQPGSRIAVLCEPSADVIVCMLAAMKVGAAYILLDLSLPSARHEAMVANCQPDILCYHAATRDRLANAFSKQSWGLLDLSKVSQIDGVSHPLGQATPESPACLFYTSGSTGQPKGIELSHCSIINFVAGVIGSPELATAVVLQQSSLGFDMSMAQIFLAILGGGKLVIVPQHARGDPAIISELIEAESVTLTLATPSEYLLLFELHHDVLRRCSAWQSAMTGGEPLTSAVKRQFRRHRGPMVVDCYGPTEATCFVTWNVVPLDTDESPGNVGRPIANTSVYVLDGNRRLMPLGLPGEICIAGAGVALGYVDKPLDRGKFVECPFEKGKMFCTGDRGKLLPDGSLVFLGRMGTETTVKLRGIRIDLDEIAACLVNTAPETISDAVVTLRGTVPSSEFLVAHVVLRQHQGQLEQAETVLMHILDRLPLPRYMHPARIIPLQRLPTNSCHKVDRRVIEALPLPNRKESKADNRPLSLAEMAMQALWRDLLPDFALIEPGTDFFAAGGNSTLLVRLQAAIKNSTACSIPLGDLYRAATLRSMAALVGERENAELVKDELEDIDWDRETKPADVTTGKGNDELSSKKQDLEVMMAGGTGLLGKAILQSLLQDPRISRIHCVAIPAEEKPHFLRSVDSPKVVAYSGSLRHPTLGLSEADVAQLEAQVSMLIHAGAEGTCVSRYDSLREANVQSTRWLASFAASLAITMHYISYGRVIPLSGMASYPPASLAAHRPPSRPHDGFVASKWASERILEATAHHFGLQAFIHRPCSLSSDKALSTDALAALVHYSPLLRAVPYLPILEGYIDIRDVAELGDDIFQTCLRLQRVGEQKEDQTQATTMFYHYSTGVRIPVADFRKYIEAQVNESVVEIPYAEWAVKAAELGMDPELVDFVHWKIETGSPVLLPFLGEKH